MFTIVSLGPTTMPGTQQMLKKKKKTPKIHFLNKQTNE